MSQLFTSGGQSIGASASGSVLPMSIQGWFPLGWTGLMSWQSKGLSSSFSSTPIYLLETPAPLPLRPLYRLFLFLLAVPFTSPPACLLLLSHISADVSSLQRSLFRPRRRGSTHSSSTFLDLWDPLESQPGLPPGGGGRGAVGPQDWGGAESQRGRGAGPVERRTGGWQLKVTGNDWGEWAPETRMRDEQTQEAWGLWG